MVMAGRGSWSCLYVLPSSPMRNLVGPLAAAFLLAVGAETTVTAQTTPTITAVLNGASFENKLSPGSYARIYGSNLGTVNSVPVFVGGRQAYVSGASSSNQLDIQIPIDAPLGLVPVTVGTSAPFNVTIAQYAPAVFTQNGSGASTVFAVDASGGAITSSNPVRAGETITIYGTGLGPTAPAVPTGTLAPANPLAITLAQPTVTIGGQPAAVSFSGLRPGLVGINQVSVTVPNGVGSGNQPIVLTIAGVQSQPGATLPLGTVVDFNLDGRVDVLWQDPVSGFAQTWLLGGAQGTSIMGEVNLTSSNSWRAAGLGDFNQDGRVDAVWQDPITGAVQVWFLGGVQGNEILAAAVLTGPNAWRIRSVADFNADGRVDLVWQDQTSGMAQIWLMGGATGVTLQNTVNLAVSNLWHIVGSGDFNADGSADMVWQDPVTGAAQIWYLGGAQGNQVNGAANVGTGSTWRIVSVADYNADGKPDLVWQEPSTGASQVWLLGGTAGTTLIGSSGLSSANTWRIVGPR